VHLGGETLNFFKHVRTVYLQTLADDVTRHSSGTDSDPQLTIPLFKNGVESLREFAVGKIVKR
jgi:hypothetical protein